MFDDQPTSQMRAVGQGQPSDGGVIAAATVVILTLAAMAFFLPLFAKILWIIARWSWNLIG